MTLNLVKRVWHHCPKGIIMEEIPSTFQREFDREHMTCLLGLRMWWNLCPREAWVAQYFICITGLNLLLYLYLLIKSSITCSRWLWAVSAGQSEMEQMRVCGFFCSGNLRIYLDWIYPSSLQVKSTLIRCSLILSTGWLTTNIFELGNLIYMRISHWAFT